MYCKCLLIHYIRFNRIVLIVAKCIVNKVEFLLDVQKVLVLIVAKCIVNFRSSSSELFSFVVLIVAKCIVNFKKTRFIHLLFAY